MRSAKLFFVPLSTQGMQALFHHAASERVTQLGGGTGQSLFLCYRLSEREEWAG